MSTRNLHILYAAVFLLPLFLYEEVMLSAMLGGAGIMLMSYEKISHQLTKLSWREFVFIIYMFHMLFGERSFAQVGMQPIFITEIVLAVLTLSYAKDLLRVRKVLFVYYLIVLVGLAYAFIYLFDYRIDAIRDSFMLLYAFWVPLVYHIFRKEELYDLFFNLLKLFIVLSAIHYVYEFVLILMDLRAIVFEGFRFGIGYIMPSLIVISLFLPLKYIDWKYKLLSLIMIPAVFTAFHRSIFLGIILAVALIFVIGHFQSRKNILIYGAAASAVMVGFLILYNMYVEVDLFRILEIKTSMEEGNINYRVMSWEHVLGKFYENMILGFGVGKPIMFMYQNVLYDAVNLTYFEIAQIPYANAQPHNSYLNILARFGILIFPLFLLTLFAPLFKIRHFIELKGHNGMQVYSRFLFLTGFLLFMYVFAFFNVVLEGPHHSFPFWLVIGMLLSFGRVGHFSPKIIRLKRVVSAD